jgi:membrane-bound serine protease (ClpP class)
MFLAVLLQALGIGVIIAEFVVPSMGLLTAAAVGIFGYSLYVVFSGTTMMTGAIFVIVDMIMIPVLIYFGVQSLGRSPMSLKKSLKSEDGVTSQDPEHLKLVGARGIIISTCRPAGRAEINGRKHDVVSVDEFLNPGTEIEVAEVNGNRIVVKKVEKLRVE